MVDNACSSGHPYSHVCAGIVYVTDAPTRLFLYKQRFEIPS